MKTTVNNIEFIDIWKYHKDSVPFNIFIGGRRTGKTYSGLGGAIEEGDPFIYMRRLNSELELNADPDNEDQNPFSWLNEDQGWNFGMEMISEREAHILDRNTGDVRGYGLALSTMAKLRGINLKSVRYWLYDEFIKELHVSRIKGECDALLNAYMSLNSNREMKGEPPIYLDLCSNATDIYNDIFIGLNIVADVEKAIGKGQKDIILTKRGLGIHLLEPAKSFTEAIQKTAIFKLTKGTRFAASAFNNEFAYNDFSLVKYQKLTGWRPIAKFKSKIQNCKGTIYKCKGDRRLHVSYADGICPEYNLDHEQDEILFRRKVGVSLYNPYINGKLTFESYQLKCVVLEKVV